MKKIVAIGLALVLTLGGLGAVYAAFTDTVTIDGAVETGVVSWCYDDPINPGFPHVMDSDDGPDPVAAPASNPEGKDVAWKEYNFVDSDFDGDYDVMEMTVHNAYPYYTNHIDFWLHNNGTLPIKLDYVVISGGGREFTLSSTQSWKYFDLDGNGTDDFKILWGNSWGAQTEPCEYYNLSFDIVFLQDVGVQGKQNLKFTITIHCIQWNEY
jgi:predicted ribosomally synthesized peptide with SipW-like signal peptide